MPSTVHHARLRAVEGGGVARGVLREDQAGLDDRQRVVEAREVAGQRVVGRDRRQERAGAQGAEHQQGVLEAVVAEDGDGLAAGTKALRDQPRGDGTGARPGLGVGQALPGPIGAASLG